jgi:threonine/homoserine/homoserine lactone efflux protein
MTLVAFSFLQFFFVGLLVILVGVVGLFFVFLAAQLIRNPGRGPRTRT